MFASLLSVVPAVPQIPASVDSFIHQIIDYVVAGFGIIAAFTFWPIISALVIVTLALFLAWHAYQFIMFVLRKIPVLGIE